jgi:hypothetical protein
MKYLKLYEQFRLILEKLDSQGKQLFLLCGPSATGKTYLAGQLGIQHWTKTSDFKGNCLITTDGEDGEPEKITELLEAKGCPKLAEISKSEFGKKIGIFMIAYEGDGVDKKWLEKWNNESSEEEKKILNPLFEVLTKENTFCPNTNQQDSRVLKLALVAHLWESGRILFDDVRPTINNIYDVKEFIIYTPITTYLSDNLTKRLVKEPNMNVKGKIKKFFEWFQLSETPDSSFPDDKKYTLEEVEASMKGLKQKKTEDVIDTYGTGSPTHQMRNTEFGDIQNTKYQLRIKIEDFVTISKMTDKMKEDGFYFKKGGIQGDKDKSPVFNSRSGENLSL